MDLSWRALKIPSWQLTIHLAKVRMESQPTRTGKLKSQTEPGRTSISQGRIFFSLLHSKDKL